MPRGCIVPMCSKQTGGHRFPKDELRLKQWLVAMRKEQYTPSKYSIVCRDHFTKDDYTMPKDSTLDIPRPILKNDAVPSIFPWNNPTNELIFRKRQKRYQRCSNRNIKKKKYLENGNDTIADIKSEMPSFEFAEVEITYDKNFQIGTTQNDIGVQCNLCKCQMNLTNDLKIAHQGSKRKSKKFLIEKVMDINDPTEVQFYTGFQNFYHFKFIYNLFGEEVNYLKYCPNMKTFKKHVLNPCDEFLMTVVKLRRNTSFSELSFRFNVHKTLLRNLFKTWITYLYSKFKGLNEWVPKHLIDKNMRYTGKDDPCSVLIDCTEIVIEKPTDPTQELTPTTSTSRHSLKLLVGISASGCIMFVSDAYEGSISDSELFEKCGLIDKIQPNDTPSDSGFNVQNVVCDKDVTVNVSESQKHSDGQFQTSQLRTSKENSSARIHVKKLIGLAKTFKVLSGKLDSELVPLADQIIFVCFMLTNFKSSIVK